MKLYRRAVRVIAVDTDTHFHTPDTVLTNWMWEEDYTEEMQKEIEEITKGWWVRIVVRTQYIEVTEDMKKLEKGKITYVKNV